MATEYRLPWTASEVKAKLQKVDELPTKDYVNTEVETQLSALVNAAPETLNTLDELAAALGDDPNFATTVANEIGTKVSKSGDTMTGSLTIDIGGTAKTQIINYDNRTFLRNIADGDNYRDIVFGEDSARISGKKAGVDFNHDILHTGNIDKTARRLDSRGTVIPDNSDLNNYITPGNFYVPASTNAATIANTPITGAGYRLIVSQEYGGAALISQTAIGNIFATQFYRCGLYDSSTKFWTWQPWEEIAVVSKTAKQAEHKIPHYVGFADIGLKDADMSSTDLAANLQAIYDAMPAYSELWMISYSGTSYTPNFYASLNEKIKADIGGMSSHASAYLVYITRQAYYLTVTVGTQNSTLSGYEYSCVYRNGSSTPLSTFSITRDPNGFVSKSGDTMTGTLNTNYLITNGFQQHPDYYGTPMEIGQYIDMHLSGSNADFDGRLYVGEGKSLCYAKADVGQWEILHTGNKNLIAPADIGAATTAVVTTTAAGLMSAADKKKLDGIATGANKYSLPNATSSVLGGVKIGSNITVSSGTISLSQTNVTSALGYTPAANTTFVKSGSGAKAGLVPAPSTTAGTTKYLREDGTWTTPPGTTATMTAATASAAGKAGLVPAPAAGKQASFLRGDGTWVVPTDTKVTQAAAITTNGEYPVLIAYSTATTEVTNKVNKTSTVKINPSTGKLTASSVAGAVYNDYAEYRNTDIEIDPGRVVIEKGDDTLKLSTDRLQPGGNIVSDTFGFSIGQTEICNTPIAVSGRVLAYPYEDRNSYKPGDAVCTGPNGTVSKMTREEIMKYPERIIGTVSAIPNYDVWGSNEIKVNNRIWIKIK